LHILDLQAGETVLEIGPGPGQALPVLAATIGKSGRLFALDLSPNMLAQARARLYRESLSERVFLLEGDAVALPFGPGRIDAVFMSFTLELFSDSEIPGVLCECKRIMRSAGRLALVALSDRGPLSPAKRLYNGMHRRFPRLVDCRPIPVQEWLAASGFEIASSAMRSLWGIPVETVCARKLGEEEGSDVSSVVKMGDSR
jgi:demethylmenaquinone methyltransferase/2-methoxy-6-polyprenyl-1,4-benzoquinol methylase